MAFKKVLIAAPTSAYKHYCFEDWLDNALKIQYPNFKIVLFDNTSDDGESAAYQNEYYRKNYGGDQFECIKSDISDCDGDDIISVICKSHNENF